MKEILKVVQKLSLEQMFAAAVAYKPAQKHKSHPRYTRVTYWRIDVSVS